MLMFKIYTRKGDQGKTFLLNNKIVLKTNEQVQICSLIEKINIWIGYLFLNTKVNRKWKKYLKNFVYIFFLMSSEISYISKNSTKIYSKEYLNLLLKNIVILEKEINYMDKYTNVLKGFILPANCKIVFQIHVVRNYIRDLESNLVYLSYKQYFINFGSLSYCNRLSDFFFMLARYYTFKDIQKDILL